jgi:hypothetical protein
MAMFRFIAFLPAPLSVAYQENEWGDNPAPGDYSAPKSAAKHAFSAKKAGFEDEIEELHCVLERQREAIVDVRRA